MKNILRIILLGVVIVFGAAACSVLNMISDPPTPAVLEAEVLPHKVAILPFVNKTSNPEAATIIRKMFYNFFSSLNYLDIELALIDDNLRSSDLFQKIVAGENVSATQLGQLLGVDAVIFGEVLSLGKMYALVYSNNQAGLKAWMVRCNSGQVLWELEHKIYLEEGDVPLSILDLATTVFRTAISHQRATHMQAASELCMQVVATIPDPPALTEAPPKIQVLVHNAAGKLLRSGDYLNVALIGEKGQTASWSISPLIENHPMQEKEPGVYIGSYRIRPQDQLTHGRLVGYLRSETGAASQWADTLGPVKIGNPTLLPSIISEDTVLNQDQNPYLVKDALMVLPGAKLVLNPGTVIWFRGFGLIVKGEIQIRGTAQAPVRLAALESSAWKGLFFDHSRTENKIDYCEILNAEFGIRASNSTVFVQNCLFQDNTWGIVMEESSADIYGSLIRTCEKTGIAARKARLTVKDSVITENKSGGLLLDNSQIQIEHNNILNNGGWGIKVLGNSKQVHASNNWWGKKNPDPIEIIGPVDIQPVLEKPVACLLLD